MDKNYIELMKRRPDLFYNTDNLAIEVITDLDKIYNIEKEMAEQYIKDGYPENWAKVGIIFKDKYITILRDAVIFGGKISGVYDRIIMNNNKYEGVIILPIFNGEIVLINHFRHSIRDWQLEIPMGFLEKNLSFKENAIKEIKEEINGNVSTIEPIGELLTDAGIGNKRIILYCANLISYGESNDVCEPIKDIKTYSLDEVEDLIYKGIITDSLTIGAIFKFKLRTYK